MTRRAQAGVLVAVAIAGAGFWMWRSAATPAERAIRNRFEQFAEELNAGTTDGLGSVARAARIGQFFTPDVVVELGRGSPPIHGRETLIGMSARLQPRTAAFVFEFSDVTIDVVEQTRAEVVFTMVIRRRNVESRPESIDAREFSVEMRNTDGEWRVSRAVAIDTLR